jgi:hypothetical protein
LAFVQYSIRSSYLYPVIKSSMRGLGGFVGRKETVLTAAADMQHIYPHSPFRLVVFRHGRSAIVSEHAFFSSALVFQK